MLSLLAMEINFQRRASPLLAVGQPRFGLPLMKGVNSPPLIRSII
jgi:hypothetical protein